LIVLVTMLTSDEKIMGDRVNPWFLKWAGWATAVVMTVAAIAMFVV
jgi:Mn2+/Fe2+ NRAMP family transporter